MVHPNKHVTLIKKNMVEENPEKIHLSTISYDMLFIGRYWMVCLRQKQLIFFAATRNKLTLKNV